MGERGARASAVVGAQPWGVKADVIAARCRAVLDRRAVPAEHREMRGNWMTRC
jgi:hypothetical protein